MIMTNAEKLRRAAASALEIGNMVYAGSYAEPMAKQLAADCIAGALELEACPAWQSPSRPPCNGVRVAIFTEGGVSIGWWDVLAAGWFNAARQNKDGTDSWRTVEVDAWMPLPDPPQIARKILEEEESGWVIEHEESDGSAPRYFTGVYWTDAGDHSKALRYARECDAKFVADHLDPPNKHRVREHMWVAGTNGLRP